MEQKDKTYEFKQVEVRLKVKEGDPLYSTDPVNCPEAAVKLLADYIKDMDRECVYVLNFDNAMRPLSFHLTSMGGKNYAPMDPANIFKSAMLTNASYIMLMHVYPSGNLKPSHADIAGTEKISLLGNLLNIPVRDHLIVGGGTGEYVSLKAEMPDIFHDMTDNNTADCKEQEEEQASEEKTEKAEEKTEAKGEKTEEKTEEKKEDPKTGSSDQGAAESKPDPEKTPIQAAEPSQPYDPLALTLDQKEILFVKEAPEAMELAKALEALGNENAGITPPEGDKGRQEWLLGTAQDIKDGNTDTIIKAVSDMSENTQNIAVAKKAVDFLVRLDAVKGKWEPASKEAVKAFELKDASKLEKAKNAPDLKDKSVPIKEKLEAAKLKADAINASKVPRHSVAR